MLRRIENRKNRYQGKASSRFLRKAAGRLATTFAMILMLLVIFAVPVSAQVAETRVNSDSGYEMVILDDANLLDENSSQINEIWQQMERISAYGNVALYTTDYNNSSTDSLAKSIYRDWFGRESGTIFVIDMDNRQLYIFSDGKINKTITRSVALTITDNVYRQASKGNYEACALETFTEIATKVEGGRIAAPMRYLSALFFALLVALIITFIGAKYSNSTKMTAEDEYIRSVGVRQMLNNSHLELIKRSITKKSSGGSGGIGGSGGGGGGFGGGGSGGGHGF